MLTEQEHNQLVTAIKKISGFTIVTRWIKKSDVLELINTYKTRQQYWLAKPCKHCKNAGHHSVSKSVGWEHWCRCSYCSKVISISEHGGFAKAPQKEQENKPTFDDAVDSLAYANNTAFRRVMNNVKVTEKDNGNDP